MAIGTVLDNDTNLDTDAELAKGAQAIARLIEYRARQFRMSHDPAGVSFLQAVTDAVARAVAANANRIQ